MQKWLLFTIFTAMTVFTSGADTCVEIEDCVLIKSCMPDRGIVCSNAERVIRLSRLLQQPEMIASSWGPFVITGTYKGKNVFLALAPIGSGAGLLFTELYAAGARYILRYGSEDAKPEQEFESNLIKIVDEADNLYGFEMQNGVRPSEWGKPIAASIVMVEAIETVASQKGLVVQRRLCHHLENYHALRSSHKYLGEKGERIRHSWQQMDNKGKPVSFDMESAVLFRIAKDFDRHAATVLQTVNKQSKKDLPYRGENGKLDLNIEDQLFAGLVFDALIAIN